MKFILRMLISAGALFGVAYLSDQALLQVDNFWPAAVIAALVLAFANAVVKPIVKLFALPITILTLGLFGLIINAGMLYLVAAVVDGVHTTGLWQTVVASILISIVSSIGTKLVETDR
ncbi:MAG: phage holin family protein [Coriobacteriia bacterium]|nr:phage holin family protein [Coriobacteriia bacterium]MBN2823043.1 phage holin family protein [Coriobacteriia bacterium]